MPTTLSPLRYPGGKTKIYQYVKNILEYNNLLGQTYIEPFAGGAGLAIKLLLNGDVKRIVINDYDPAIYAFWYSVLNNTEELCNLIQQTNITPLEWKRQREIYRKQDVSNSLELGFSTFFLNRTNVSGVIKGGMIGGFEQGGTNNISARFNKSNLIQKIQNISEYRNKIVLFNLDAKELLQPKYLRRFYKALINFDPPYVRKGSQLYQNSFKEEDHRTLSEIILKCSRKWIVTYDICTLIADLYSNYRFSYLDVTYTVQKSKKAKEYIFFSNNLNLPEYILKDFCQSRDFYDLNTI
ncbi:DNA-methyltransferase [Desulfosporosinus sp. I2]|uniref:DNA adenine methylase n=1 Tax=Desulfosporosinus sp. I2 TaxID=1617025 RepID=UPI0005ED4C2F|nr:DNA adenine methylase [Desulfosporosinus sp. I2]KJR44455.1 DNA-methyltransferase [Desulfosporosinus sp. I2]